MDLNKIIICIIKNNHICICSHVCTVEPEGGSSHRPRPRGRPIVAGELLGWGPQPPRPPAVLHCRAAGHRRGRCGAAGPQARSFSASSLRGRFPAFLGEKTRACTLEMQENSLIALPIVWLGEGQLRFLETFAPFSLGFRLLEPETPSKICLF